ncbi:No apical meristem (NAM) protein [Corchorus capsularis]|uniref:No apical meristem (NAM) protein n=1 Tax=Corchorus capsularis TaxID=210143 RepID=A0A1R3HLX8_COCAP|nr:No apical meristem (NAM) protein [Corchorus capsularis]
MSEIVMPHGVRFYPEKEEIFSYYLYPAINGESIPYAEVDKRKSPGICLNGTKTPLKLKPNRFGYFTKRVDRR